MTWLPVSDGFARSECGRFDLIRTPDRIPGGWLWLCIDGDLGRTFKALRGDCAAWAKGMVGQQRMSA